MIIITERAAEIAEWIDRNLDLTSYTLGYRRIHITIHPDDELIFELRWHGCFIHEPVGDVWLEAGETNQLIVQMKAALASAGLNLVANPMLTHK